MLSICCNSHIKSRRNRKTFQKNSKIKPLRNRYNWEEIGFPSEKDDWKIFEKNNRIFVLNIFYAKKERLYPAYVLKLNSNSEKQVILFNQYKRSDKEPFTIYTYFECLV